MPETASAEYPGWKENRTASAICPICSTKKDKVKILICANSCCSYRFCTGICLANDPGLQDRVRNGCWCQRAGDPAVEQLKAESRALHAADGAALRSTHPFTNVNLNKILPDRSTPRRRQRRYRGEHPAEPTESGSLDEVTFTQPTRDYHANAQSDRSLNISKLTQGQLRDHEVTAVGRRSHRSTEVPPDSKGPTQCRRGRSMATPPRLQSVHARLPLRQPSSHITHPESATYERRSDLNHCTTVIIGAGVIGLSIARELALAANAHKIKKHTVVIIDLAVPFLEASHHNPGILSFHNVPEQLNQLAEASRKIWEEETRDEHFRSAVGFETGSIFATTAASPHTDQQFTSPAGWFKGKHGWGYGRQSGTFGLLNPALLGKWLLSDCVRLGVKVLGRHQLTHIQRAQSRDIRFVRVRNLDTLVEVRVPCHNLIFAAGAWTPYILSETSSLNFKPQFDMHEVAADWIEVSNERKNPAHDTAFVLSSGLPPTSPDEKSARWATSRRSSSTIWIASSPTPSSLQGPPGSHSSRRPSSPHASLPEIASQYLLHHKYFSPHTHVQRRGRTHTSTLSDGLPVLAKAPASALGDGPHSYLGHSAGVEDSPYGVWLAFGFGRYGLTLAPAVARVVAGMVFGQPRGGGVAAVAARCEVEAAVRCCALPAFEGMGFGVVSRPVRVGAGRKRRRSSVWVEVDAAAGAVAGGVEELWKSRGRNDEGEPRDSAEVADSPPAKRRKMMDAFGPATARVLRSERKD